MMEWESFRVPVAEIREALLELCTYIPYFEERVGGTFKFQYCDELTGEWKDYEGYEEANRQASFPDPLSDETYEKFNDTVIRNVTHKFIATDMWSRFRKTKMSDWELPVDKLGWLLEWLTYAVIHERMFTGYTAMCMKDGTYLRLLKGIGTVLPEVPDDAVFVCSRMKRRKAPSPGTGNGGEPSTVKPR